MTDDDVREIVYQALRAIRATPEPTSGVRVGVLSYNETVAFDAIARALADQRGACVDSPKPTVADSKLRQKANTSMSEGATQAPPRDSGREEALAAWRDFKSSLGCDPETGERYDCDGAFLALDKAMDRLRAALTGVT